MSNNASFENNLEKYMQLLKEHDFNNNIEKSKLDLEFEHYCELYEKKFHKKPYIAEPNGTKEKTILAIKVCLEQNKDLLDELLYYTGNISSNEFLF